MAEPGNKSICVSNLAQLTADHVFDLFRRASLFQEVVHHLALHACSVITCEHKLAEPREKNCCMQHAGNKLCHFSCPSRMERLELVQELLRIVPEKSKHALGGKILLQSQMTETKLAISNF